MKFEDVVARILRDLEATYDANLPRSPVLTQKIPTTPVTPSCHIAVEEIAEVVPPFGMVFFDAIVVLCVEPSSQAESILRDFRDSLIIELNKSYYEVADYVCSFTLRREEMKVDHEQEKWCVKLSLEARGLRL